MSTQLVLGTAQLGMPYGIANQAGQPSLRHALEILRLASEEGISLFDTAPGYGNSEEIIGRFLQAGSRRVSVSTKLPSVHTQTEGRDWKQVRMRVRRSLKKSLFRLRRKRLDYYLIHDEQDVMVLGDRVLGALQVEKEKGYINRLGLSAYSPSVVKQAMGWEGIDALQIPLNVFDHRFREIIEEAKARGIEVFVRSVFLQGLFFLPPAEAEVKVPGTGEPIRELNRIAKKANRSVPEVAFSFVRDLPHVNGIVVGVENIDQLKENFRLMKTPTLPNNIRSEISSSFAEMASSIVNPVSW